MHLLANLCCATVAYSDGLGFSRTDDLGLRDKGVKGRIKIYKSLGEKALLRCTLREKKAVK